MNDFLIKFYTAFYGSPEKGLEIAYCVFPFILMALVLLAIVVIALCIVMIVRHMKVKKIFAKLRKTDISNDVEQRKQIRAELETEVRAELEKQYADIGENGITDEQYTRLKERLQEKDDRIKELTTALQNNDNSQLTKTIDDLNWHNTQLTEQNNLYHNEIAELQAEIARLKETAATQADPAPKAQAQPAPKPQPQSAATESAKPAAKAPARKSTKKPPVQVTPSAAAKSTKSAGKTTKAAAKQQPAPQPAVVEDDDDEWEEDNEFGGADSAIKVTLKFDRNSLTWIILRSDSTRTYRRLATKQEAMPIARDLAKRLSAQLVVHKRDGKFQKVT